ncbi:NAD(P) transhydrogenase subunit alpha [Oenococcus alcoholitolerans]|uniref:NAD(P) transhydrogenase subunit alpha n=1 Tax=Oenococcus alcoholitolerans TaxID=931074 RepID=UPI003F7252AA
MSQELYTNLAIFVLSLLVGFEVMSKIPSTLQTPMMSGANAIHGVVVVGAFAIAAEADNWLLYILVFLAAFFAAVNVTGGYTVTDRMLAMFDRKPAGKEGANK